MKILWAPWRMSYLRGEYEKVKGCVFCQKISGNDADEQVLYRGQYHFVTLNRFPYSNGHMMIVPYAHVASLGSLSDGALLEMMRLAKVCERILRKVQRPQGFNLGINEGTAAGAGIEEHLHMHIVPRWSGDANYMTVVGQTRVLPQMLEETYALLRPYFDAYVEDETTEG